MVSGGEAGTTGGHRMEVERAQRPLWKRRGVHPRHGQGHHRCRHGRATVAVVFAAAAARPHHALDGGGRGEVMNDAVAAPSTGDPATAVELPPPPAGGGGAYTASPLIMLPRESPCSSGGGGASLAARLERRHAPRISFHRVGDQHTARRLSPPQRGGHRRVHPVVAVAGALPARAGRRPTNWAGEIRPELSARKCTSVRRGLPAAVGRGHAPLDASVVGHFGRSVGRHIRVPADAHSRRRDHRRQRPPSPPPSPLPLLPLPLLLLSMPLSSSVTTALPHHPQTNRSQRNVRARADRRRDEEHIPRQKVDPAPH